MLKGTSLILGAFIAITAFAGQTGLDCQTSANLEEISNVLDKVDDDSDDCPTPNANQFASVCNAIYDRVEAVGDNQLSYKYQEDLWTMSCADPSKDTIDDAKLKVQKMWNANREQFKCRSVNATLTEGNVTKFSIDTGFSGFIVEAVKKYKLDMNFKDPADGKTLLDFVQEQKNRFEREQPIDQPRVDEYARIYKLLESNGAKHSKDL